MVEHRRRLGLLACVVVAAGCGDPGTSVRVTVEAHGAIALSTLSVTIAFDSADPAAPITVLDGRQQVSLPADLVVGVPDKAMDVQLHLDGQDGETRPVAATGLVRSVPRQQVKITLTLSGPGAFGDGGVVDDDGGVLGDDGGGGSLADLALPPCSNGVRDGAETDVDCGGGACAACPDGKLCVGASDCASTNCASGRCAPQPCAGVTCGANETCPTPGTCACSATQKAGGPACASGQTCCATGCFNLMTSAAHCGSCTVACLAGETCSAGACTCGGGARCAAGTTCVGGHCRCSSCNGCCAPGGGNANDQCAPGTTAPRCGAVGSNCTSCSGRTDTCQNRSCVCAASGAVCPPGWSCTATRCAPDTCEAITGQGGTNGTWFTSGATCNNNCAAPATCLFKSDCQGYPCPGGHCYKCI